MKIFLDTANFESIKRAVDTGLIDGVTTNPSLLSKEGEDPILLIKKICSQVKGPVNAEVTSTDIEGMISEAKAIAEISDNLVVKLPMTENGLKATYHLSKNGIKINVTLIFSPLQSLLAMKSGARYISPFVGRVDDISLRGMSIVEDIIKIRNNYKFNTELIVASIRNPLHILDAAKCGVDIVTVPPSVFWQLYKHPLTDIGLEKFLADWKTVSNNNKKR